MTAACSNEQTTENKDMNQLSFTTEQAACMSAIACNEAKGDLVALESAIHGGLEAELTVSQIKEALSQLYAYTGFPRSLNALGTLQRVIGDRQTKGAKVLTGEDASPLSDDYDALKEGTRVQTQLTGKPFNYEFAPATDYYLKAHLFGDIFARDNLTYADRELVTVSALSGLQGVEPQLKAHIAGARNMGVTEEQLQGIVVALAANGLLDEAGRLAGLLETEWPQGKPNDAYAQYFVGQSFLQPYYGGVANVTFEPRCRNNWHVHHGAVQVLICVSGKGWYQEWGRPAVALTPGTVIAIPEGVKHWHGAAADSWMQHLAIHTQELPGATNEWLEPVNDIQYNQVY
ncbi:MAG: carboxymuconolactone decarboxylase family protein [Paludibacteraceae bacterium]|nr:carboxymuconolactone decarboxylase family protein [Paludibacteraceae bacterium]MBR0064178.1 carboxymuconolactone decarboxylase family protein [Paludibacteraceae bacterium]